jgi:hypothetical protein
MYLMGINPLGKWKADFKKSEMKFNNTKLKAN